MLRLTVFLHWFPLGNGSCLGKDGEQDRRSPWPLGVCGPVGETESYTSHALCRDGGSTGCKGCLRWEVLSQTDDVES